MSVPTYSSTASTKEHLSEHGFAVVEGVYSGDDVTRFQHLTGVARREVRKESVSNRRETYGFRNLVDVIPETRELLQNSTLSSILGDLFGQPWFMVRSTLFDKTPKANWGVFWHQDRAIAVRERHAIDNFGNWTRKGGILCVQPPATLMERILAVRIHLDDARTDNGALRVLPGTHRTALTETEIADSQQNATEQIVEVGAGGILLMNPLLLHASSPMNESESGSLPPARRVIHLEFADFELPKPLEWRYRVTGE